MSSENHWLQLVLLIAIFFGGTIAQSLYDATPCPREAYYRGGCTIRETTNATDIGITTYDKNMLAPEPITWTAVVSSEGGNHAESILPDVYERSYFLGTPAAFNSDKNIEDLCVLILL